MSLEVLVSRYITSAEHVLGDLTVSKVCVNVDVESINEVLESAKAYLADAKHYRDNGRLEVGLTSVAYCEGLLDALRSLGMVKFEWPARKQEER